MKHLSFLTFEIIRCFCLFWGGVGGVKFHSAIPIGSIYGIFLPTFEWHKFMVNLGGGFKYFLFSPLFGEDSHFDQYFSNGLKPPTRNLR